MTDEQPILNILGDAVALGPLRRDLITTYQRWINDFGTVRTILIPPVPMTLEQETAWYDGRVAVPDDVSFTIYERATLRPIGNTGLHGINYRGGTATFGIMTGEPDCRGKGYGTEATRLMLDYAFTALGLHNVLLSVWEYNLAGRRAYAKAGFKECGRRRECRPLGDRRWEEIYMDCLATEFDSPVLHTVFVPDEPR